MVRRYLDGIFCGSLTGQIVSAISNDVAYVRFLIFIQNIVLCTQVGNLEIQNTSFLLIMFLLTFVTFLGLT